jgi:hypothetical protein
MPRFGTKSPQQRFFLGSLTAPPRAWRPGLEPAELSFRVPHFFHQTRRGFRGQETSMMFCSLATKKTKISFKSTF